jgi:hypothetical protein
MSRPLAEFIVEFVLPLMGGGPVRITRPIRPRDFYEMVAELSDLRQARTPDLEFLRLRRAQLLVADPILPEIDLDELGLWVGLHNTLVLDHPDRERVWTRELMWRRVESTSRTLLTLSQPSDLSTALVRHVVVGPFIELTREDHILHTPEGDERFAGQPVPRGRVRFSSLHQINAHVETIEWLADSHTLEVERLIQDALWASPLTCLLRPLAAPPGWTCLIAAPFLLQRGFARAVCNTWAASSKWIEIGGAIIAGLMEPLVGPVAAGRAQADIEHEAVDDNSGPRALGPGTTQAALPGSTFGAGPREIGAMIGALVHVHFLKVLELGARLGLAASSRDRSVQNFLALPLVLPKLAATLGEPMSADARALGFDHHVARRWTEYLDHLGELIPQSVVENLVAALVPRIVQATSA